jgi:glycosyltransferase involved in cell wall biosynthesis
VVGATDLREEHLAARFRVYVECDPVIAELQLAKGDPHTVIALANHHAIVTYGENFGSADCGVPLNGQRYGKTRQPVDLVFWPMVYEPEARFFTTIGNYRQDGNDVEYKGEIYHWSKHHEWEKFMDLPRRTSQPLELAMKVEDPADRLRLESYGWKVVPPFEMSLDIFGAYQAYFRRSRAEFTVAKDMNVRLRSGWFSERDACYLACGKPVVAQDTGFGNILPTGEGLFPFTTTDEGLAAIDQINGDYRRHCLAARAIAEEYFAAPKVAARLLADLGMA